MIAQALGSPGRPAHELLRDLIKRLGMPSTLQEVGVRRDQFQAIADGALQNMWVRANPRPIDSTEQVFEILESCWGEQ